MGKLKDITGKRYGRLLVLEFSHKTPNKYEYWWKCRCDCGKEILKSRSHLNGNCKSCGCLNAEMAGARMYKHGLIHTGAYKSWRAMKQRCLQPSHPYYPNYGERGIKVCDKWLEFEGFYEDMGPRPEGCSLDRINGNGDYEKSNCRWADKEKQSNNKVDNHFMEYNGERFTVAQWARQTGLSVACLEGRLRMGWDEEKILTTPMVDKKRKLIKYNGVSKTIAGWAKELGVERHIIYNKLKSGLVIEDILAKLTNESGV